MPISLTEHGSEGRLAAAATGTVTLEDLKTFLATALAGDQRQCSLLLDLGNASTDMKTPDIQLLARQLSEETKRTGPSGRVAIVAASDETYGVARMLMSYCVVYDVDQVAVFRSTADAEYFLDG